MTNTATSSCNECKATNKYVAPRKGFETHSHYVKCDSCGCDTYHVTLARDGFARICGACHLLCE